MITGSSGYLGSALVKYYLSLGHEVIGIDKTPTRYEHKDFQEKAIELRVQEEALEQLIETSKPDVMIHSAALVPLTRSYEFYEEINGILPKALYEACVKGKVRHFIHISSSAVFTPKNGGKVDTSQEPSPVEPYGRSKALAEKLLSKPGDKKDTKLSIVRPRTIIGDYRGGIISLLFSWLDRGLPLYLIGGRDEPFQFVEVGDLCEAISTIEASGSEGFFNIGTDEFGSLRDLYAFLIEHTGSESKIRKLPDFGIPSILWLMEKVGLSPLAPWHYRTYSKGFYFPSSGLEQTDWKPQKSNNQMFIDAWRNRVPELDLSDSKHRSQLKWRLVDGFLRITR